MFLGCSYFFTKSEADVLINSVLRQNTACMRSCIAVITYCGGQCPKVPEEQQSLLVHFCTNSYLIDLSLSFVQGLGWCSFVFFCYLEAKFEDIFSFSSQYDFLFVSTHPILHFDLFSFFLHEQLMAAIRCLAFSVLPSFGMCCYVIYT